MSSIQFRLTIPKPNLKWWNSSRKELLTVVKEHHKEAWKDEKDPVNGSKWKPRQKPTGPHPILKKTGKMQNTTKFKADQHPMLFKATTNVLYGKYHQKGTSKMPQRRWLGLGGDFEDKFAKIMEKHIFKGKYTFKTNA